MSRSLPSRIRRVALALGCCALLEGPVLAADTTFLVDPKLGNSAFTAVFDAAIGERITAVSSAIDCTLTVDEAALTGKASCSVPLVTIRVDADETKSEHFAEWATNKKVEPAQCTFDLEIAQVKLPSAPAPKQPVAFATEGRFTICGRARDDRGAERISGTLIDLPPGTHGEKRAIRIRARIEGFDRERYGISPKATAGWLARVQQLADVVATQGTIEVNAFAVAAGEGRPSAAE